MRSAIALLLLLSLTGNPMHTNAQLPIYDKPLPFDSTRQALTLQYLRERHGLEQTVPSIAPKMIVIHWTTIPTLEEVYKTFESSRLPGVRKEIQQASALNVSAHFMVDRNGKVYRLLPDTVMARHIIGLNYCAIGIENVGNGTNLPLTQAQLKANQKLVEYLTQRHRIEYLIGHYEYEAFRHHPLWRETNPNYATDKDDPGEDFMKKLRQQVQHLHLKGAPTSVSEVKLSH